MARTFRLPLLLALLALVGISTSLLTIGLPSAALAQATGNVFYGHVTTVSAGDTVDVRVGGGWAVSVRLHGIECPATPRALRETAARYTARLVLDQDVRVEVRGTATRSVVYGEVYPKSGGASVNLTLVKVGLATWTPRYAPTRTDLRDAEELAKREKRGLWGADDGSNIVFPGGNTPATAATVPTTLPAAPSVAAPAEAIPAAVPQAPIRPRLDPVLTGAGVGFVLTWLVLAGYGIGLRQAFTPARMAAQVLLSLIACGAGALIAQLPFALIRAEMSRRDLLLASLGALLLPPIAALLWRQGSALASTTARLRRRASDPRSASPGYVKLQGKAQSAVEDLPRSDIGRLSGLYIREVTERYTAETPRGRRIGAPKWTEVRDRVLAVDFFLLSNEGDGTGAAHVLAEQMEETPHEVAPARWLPYHVARFYNEVPTVAWYETAYEGDTRTEVYFIPDGAQLTVWGHLFAPGQANSQPHAILPTPRVAPDPSTGKLIIADGPEQRAYSGHGAPSMMAGIAALLLGTLAIVGTLAAGAHGGATAIESALSGIGLAIALLLLLAIRRGARLAQNADAERTSGETDPLRRPATVAWEAYRHGFPGVVIGAAVGE